MVRNRFPLKSALRMAWLAVALAAATAAGATPAPVGEVTLSIGQAVVLPASGEPVAARRGSKIHPGDRIETAEGGHVHVRFIDGGLVSVRPTSRLVVEDYRYDPREVSQSTVRFRLESGVARAISGAAAEGARERFRLNTPLVAIGVRGTDFVVRTGPDQTVATVNQGAIVMAPFGAGCSAQGIGPCGSETAKLLTADMGNMLMEFRATLAQPELKPLDAVRVAPTMMAAAHKQPQNEPVATAVLPSTDESVLTAALVQGIVVRNATDPDIDSMIGTTQLAWGRWGAARGGSDFSLPRDEARAGRQVTVGNEEYLLYRMVPEGGYKLPQNLGRVSFDLQQAHAQYRPSVGATQVVGVQGGALSIDFAGRSFDTSLQLLSNPSGVSALSASGMVRDDGLFISRTPEQAIAGAAALDGRTAGYLFEKAATGGTLSGITVWSR